MHRKLRGGAGGVLHDEGTQYGLCGRGATVQVRSIVPRGGDGSGRGAENVATRWWPNRSPLWMPGSGSPVGSGPAIERRSIPLPPLSPLARDPPVVSLGKPRCDHDAMPELRRVRVVQMSLEYPTFRPAIHRYEPGSVSELRPSTRHRGDSSPVPATLMDELDQSQHVDLAADAIATARGERGLTSRACGKGPSGAPTRDLR
jgi:hypothetical protein